MAPLWQVGNGDQRLTGLKGLCLERRDGDLLKALELLAERALGQHALLVGHEMRALLKDNLLQLQHLLGPPRLFSIGHVHVLVQLLLSHRGLVRALLFFFCARLTL